VLAVVKSSSGSVANVRAVATHHIQSALVQSVVLDQAVKATGPFKGEKPFTGLRAIANVQREVIFLVAGRRAGIATPDDLKGKRVGLGVKGSGTEYVSLMLLQTYGIQKRNVDAYYDEPERLADMLLRNQLDAFVYVASDPSPFITDLANRGTIDLVPIEGTRINALLKTHRDLTPMMIGDDDYRFIPRTATLALNVVWVVDERETPYLVHGLTAALFYPGNRELLPMQAAVTYGPVRRDANAAREERHRLMVEAAQNLVIPLHPGAEQFYRQENAVDLSAAR
jgi:TRAP transporter TAXI family solute receptor